MISACIVESKILAIYFVQSANSVPALNVFKMYSRNSEFKVTAFKQSNL
jgi:hypothetical protein